MNQPIRRREDGVRWSRDLTRASYLGGEHDDEPGLLLPHHVPEVSAGVGQRSLCCDVPVHDATARDLHLNTTRAFALVLRGFTGLATSKVAYG